MNKILYLFTLLFSLTISSQDFQGQAFYKTQTAMDFGSWGDRMSAEQKKSMKERMKPFLEPVYILTFDKTKSIYQQEERLDAPGSGGGRGWGRMWASAGGPIFKDISTKKSLQSTEFMGKKFLISNDPNKIKWVMEKETKMIGNYLCFKATAKVKKPKTMTSVWRQAEKESKESKVNENKKQSSVDYTNKKVALREFENLVKENLNSDTLISLYELDIANDIDNNILISS